MKDLIVVLFFCFISWSHFVLFSFTKHVFCNNNGINFPPYSITIHDEGQSQKAVAKVAEDSQKAAAKHRYEKLSGRKKCDR